MVVLFSFEIFHLLVTFFTESDEHVYARPIANYALGSTAGELLLKKSAQLESLMGTQGGF